MREKFATVSKRGNTEVNGGKSRSLASFLFVHSSDLRTKTNYHFRGVARIFQRGGPRQGHHPGITDYIGFIPLLSLVYQRAQSYYRGMKAHIIKLKTRADDENTLQKKQILKKWAFQQWLLRPRY